MTAILSLLSALLYGSADFSGGHATRRNSVFSVMLLSQTAGIVVALIAAPIVGPNALRAADFAGASSRASPVPSALPRFTEASPGTRRR